VKLVEVAQRALQRLFPDEALRVVLTGEPKDEAELVAF